MRSGRSLGSPGQALDYETIIQLCEAGSASTRPVTPVARTCSVCAPSGRPLYVRGDEHAAQAAVSSLHAKRAPI